MINKEVKEQISKVNEKVDNLADCVIEYYQNGTQWYRKYKSGWLEQGGYYDGGSGYGTVTFGLVTTMSENNYTVNITPMAGNWYYNYYIESTTTTSVTARCRFGSTFKWTVWGR